MGGRSSIRSNEVLQQHPRPRLTYTWNHLRACVDEGSSSATSARGAVLIVDRIMPEPTLAAARATASSPSGWHIRCIAMGAIRIGMSRFDPGGARQGDVRLHGAGVKRVPGLGWRRRMGCPSV
ncbi:hypothetical protein F751_1326 [Auxenochlorella protothecoides]|uniref:Uncharacterized protein n=1 Tax=Auxenochlorella protothecoides TaxID=3075 RepID=A0A087SN49_AUXPR|nr:hypothetical protein F751_1326 [Auxenochlorella protothecoides]KFM27153.1 hypothetical protein F751_1326 [Auxenochlorella protothecoides]